MGNISAAVAEGARRAIGATAAFAATKHPPPVSKIPILAGVARTLWTDAEGARPHTLASIR